MEPPSHSPTREGARKEFSWWFSPCPGSHVKDSTKVLLPAFWGEKIHCLLLHSNRAQKTHLGEVQHCSPGEGARKEFLLEEGFAGVKKTLDMSYASCSTSLVSNTAYIEPIHVHIRKAEI